MNYEHFLLMQCINNPLVDQIQLLLEMIQRSVVEEEEMMIRICIIFSRSRHVRINTYFEEWIAQYLERDFFSLFRMTPNTFDVLLGKIDCPELNKEYSGGEQQVNREKQLLMFLWWVGKGETLISISDRFNVALSTVFNCTDFILSRILVLQNEYICWPDTAEMVEIENEFRNRRGYPGVIGAVDVCNIPVKIPAQYHADYTDRKMQHSIKLQGIAMTKKIFTNISVGFPGSVHDARVFRNSGIYLEVTENGNYRKYFPDDNYHILGDSAYGLLTWVITPYRDNGNLNAQQRNHNLCHSSTRIVIEHSFGLLKSRWRILHYINVNSIEKAIRIIASCCVLHNFCYVNIDYWDQYDEVDHDEDDVNVNFRNINIEAINKRDVIAHNL